MSPRCIPYPHLAVSLNPSSFSLKVMHKVFAFYQYQFLRRRDFGKNVIEDLPR
jgi:hypothetical protein